MKRYFLYISLLCILLSYYACQSGYECYGNSPSYHIVCSKNEDTVEFYALGLLGQNIEAKDYYESNGYMCIQTLSYGAAPVAYIKGSFSRKELRELENMGYRCEADMR